MSDQMTPIPFHALIQWILEEKKAHGTVFGVRRAFRPEEGKMLELFGNEALSWTIDHIERIGSGEANQYVQMQLDFREPKKARVRRTVDRGKVGPSN